MVGLDPEQTFSVDVRYGTNNQSDFFNCVSRWMMDGSLKRGNYLVFDNATVHSGTTLGGDLERIFELYGVIPVAMPTYSPELNPCELIFASIKRHIRSYDALRFDPANGRQLVVPFTQLLQEALGKISFNQVENMYRHCRHPTHM